MPIRGSNHSALIADEAPYFRSLADLDDWAATPTKKLEGVLPYVPRSEAEGVSGSATRGKLLMCHDYKVLRRQSNSHEATG
ncbi:hypothetical protein L226DRAFT_230881 [Lentinus tigrinus ALCF2SS1-7]|uniref:uncharacterized protein n=1 Tax=Lentinus tigrinus ALCF2SS1-7 TaxID=1328758 RepID=UPI001165CDBD|nr:hypothetical protein L226DRAFT_230881 [Lentinus tigrinus ALCF2SS1-7]